MPGGWSYERKIHLVAHSQGGQTVRYLQHLLSVDYFRQPGAEPIDKSDWIASVTCLAPCFNGTVAQYSMPIDHCTLGCPNTHDDYAGKFVSCIIQDTYKVVAIVQNLVSPDGTKNKSPENIAREIKIGKKVHWIHEEDPDENLILEFK